MIGLVARKCGMTRIITEDGAFVAVTVLAAEPNRVVQLKTLEHDGYSAVQVTMGSKNPYKLTKALRGHYAKGGVEPGVNLWELRSSGDKLNDIKVGDLLTVEQFTVGQKVAVTAKSKGKGFSGVIKRHNFSSQRATHGNSLAHNAPGSIGQNQTPGRVFKGKKMAGQLGNTTVTMPAAKILKIDADKNALLVQGSVPGAPGNQVIVHAGGRNAG